MQDLAAKKDQIISLLKTQGCRITKQRLLILDAILEGDCVSCKDIFYKASRKDASIGPATVYRMVNLLEEIGVIQSGAQYQILESEISGYQILLNDDTSLELGVPAFCRALTAGLQVCGYSSGQRVLSVKEQKGL